MVRLRLFPYGIAAALSLCLQVSKAQEPTAAEVVQWQRLYPKLNSKMARMEELLNFIDRFTGSSEFQADLLHKAVEFTHLAKQSQKILPTGLPANQREPYLVALRQAAWLGEKLYYALKYGSEKESRALFNDLDTLRRRSHAKWAD